MNCTYEIYHAYTYSLKKAATIIRILWTNYTKDTNAT